MKREKIFAFTLLLLFAFVGCVPSVPEDPDLVVKNLDVTWEAANKKAKAQIANIGNKDAGNFMVYFNGDEDPVSSNYRPQVSLDVQGLAAGASITLNADFTLLARPENNFLGNVFKITVIVDPKGMVSESDENNNTQERPIP